MQMSKRSVDLSNTSSHNSHSDLVMEWADGLPWFDKRQILLAIHGVTPRRHRRMEIDLHRLAKRKKLRTTYYGRKLIYALPRKTKKFDGSKIYHGLSCTECLIRLKRSWKDAEIIPERLFQGCGSVPDGGLILDDKLLLLEFSTKHNFLFSGNMRGKLTAYESNIYQIEDKFKAKARVLFILDVPRETVKRFVGSVADGDQSAPYDGADPRTPLLPFFFVDYETFLKVPIGDQLKAPIYFWTNGKEYPLKK